MFKRDGEPRVVKQVAYGGSEAERWAALVFDTEDGGTEQVVFRVDGPTAATMLSLPFQEMLHTAYEADYGKPIA